MNGWHLVDHFNNHGLIGNDALYVIGVVSNPARYNSRYRLAREWIKAMKNTKGVGLCMVESAFGDHMHEVTEEGASNHHQLRTRSEIWAKESMINLGVKNLLPSNWKYMAWIDCDVFFDDPEWAVKTIHALQKSHVVQPWQDCIDLGPHGTIMETHSSFCSIVGRGQRRQKKPGEPYKFGHPGFAWACDRYFWENTGGLLDFAILGSADHHMATALVNEVYTSMHDKMSSGFKRRCEDWQRKAYRVTQGRVGYVKGLIRHGFHGPKKRRYYRERWQILVDHGYDPDKHLHYDEQGLIQLTPEINQLEDSIRAYNLSRCEDSIEEV